MKPELTVYDPAFWATLQEHAPEVAKVLADAAPRAGVTAVYPRKVRAGHSGSLLDDEGCVFFNFCAQLDKTKEYHMHITFVEAE